MPLVNYEFTKHVLSRERKLRALRRDILGVADAGKGAVADPSQRCFFEATLEIPNTDSLEFQSYFNDLAKPSLKQGQAIFPHNSWNTIYKELEEEIKTANRIVPQLRKAELDKVSPSRAIYSDPAQIMSPLNRDAGSKKNNGQHRHRTPGFCRVQQFSFRRAQHISSRSGSCGENKQTDLHQGKLACHQDA